MIWVPVLTTGEGGAPRWSHGPGHRAHPRRPPPRSTRNRVVDLLRAGAIVVVVLGHWLIAAVVVRDGELVPGHLLELASWTHPLTWVFQVMPVFFLVGGYANALSWRSARARDVPYAGWLRSRLRRLLVPVVPLLLTWLVATSIAYAAGVPGGTLRTASQVALVPTWFLAAYVVVCAVAPATLWLWERLGWWSVVGGLLLGGAGRPGEPRHRHALGRVRELPRRVGDGAPARVRLARRAAGRHRSAAAARRRRGRGAGGAGVGRAVPRVDDRPRRGRREQLVPDPRDPGLPRLPPGRRRARRRTAAGPVDAAAAGLDRAWCCSTPGS